MSNKKLDLELIKFLEQNMYNIVFFSLSINDKSNLKKKETTFFVYANKVQRTNLFIIDKYNFDII